jgi:hypothetical protein
VIRQISEQYDNFTAAKKAVDSTKPKGVMITKKDLPETGPYVAVCFDPDNDYYGKNRFFIRYNRTPGGEREGAISIPIEMLDDLTLLLDSLRNDDLEHPSNPIEIKRYT